MKSLREAHEILDGWYEQGCIGNIIFYRPPGIDAVDALIEHTVKTREMNEPTKAAFESLIERLGAEKGEFFTNKNGEADRVKFVRGI